MTYPIQADVIDLLLAQHGQIKNALHAVEIAPVTEKQERFGDLVRLLAIHECAEEAVVHPAARRHSVSDETVAARLEEEAGVEHVLAQLHSLGVGDPRFDSQFRIFAEKVIEHAELEEQEEFGQLLINASTEELARLARVVRFAESVDPTRPNPVAGPSAAANVPVGPPPVVFDLLRDAIRVWCRQSVNA